MNVFMMVVRIVVLLLFWVAVRDSLYKWRMWRFLFYLGMFIFYLRQTLLSAVAVHIDYLGRTENLTEALKALQQPGVNIVIDTLVGAGLVMILFHINRREHEQSESEQ